MDNSLLLKKIIRPYRKRQLLRALWDGVNTGLLFALAPAVLAAFRGFTPWYSLVFLICLAGGILAKMRRNLEIYRRIDGLTGSNGELVTLSDIIQKDEPNPYLPLLFERARTRLRGNPAARCVPVYSGKRLVKTIVLLLAFWALLMLPGLIGPAEPDFYEILKESSLRLEEAAKEDSSFTPLSERLEELEEELSAEDGLEEEMKQLEELSGELTEQIRELERNSLARLFEERGKSRADAMERLSRGEMTLPETRELIMDLLSDPSVDGGTGKSIRQSFQDYSEAAEGDQNPSRQRQEKLAEDLMNKLDPEGTGLSRELKDVLAALESLAQEPDEKPGEKPGQPESAQRPEESQAGRESRRTEEGSGDSSGPQAGDSGIATTAATATAGWR